MEKALGKDALKFDAPALRLILTTMRRDFAKASSTNYRAKVLTNFAPVQRRAYEQTFALLYECSTDKSSAKLLVDRMLARLARIRRKKKS